MKQCRIVSPVMLALVVLLVSGCGTSQPRATAYAHNAQVDAEHAVADIHRHDKAGAAWWAKRSEGWLEKSTGAATHKGSGGIFSTLANIGSVSLTVARAWSLLKYVLILLAA